MDNPWPALVYGIEILYMNGEVMEIEMTCISIPMGNEMTFNS